MHLQECAQNRKNATCLHNLHQQQELPINAISSQETQRLAFIRLLVQQGVEQAAKPEPMAAAAILTFHDAVELF